MSSIDEGPRPSLSGKEEFVRKALADVERAHRFQRAKQIVVTVLAFVAAFWLALKRSGPELGIECTVVIVLGMALAVCTAQIKSLINKNTRAILQAIADLHDKSS